MGPEISPVVWVEMVGTTLGTRYIDMVRRVTGDLRCGARCAWCPIVRRMMGRPTEGTRVKVGSFTSGEDRLDGLDEMLVMVS